MKAAIILLSGVLLLLDFDLIAQCGTTQTAPGGPTDFNNLNGTCIVTFDGSGTFTINNIGINGDVTFNIGTGVVVNVNQSINIGGSLSLTVNGPGSFSASNGLNVNGGSFVTNTSSAITGNINLNGATSSISGSGAISGNIQNANSDATVFGSTIADLGGAPDCTGGCSVSVLPIELIYFRGTANDQEVNLHWVTASETNNDFFTLERSINGIEFETIATIPGAGNSNERIDYRHVDHPEIFGFVFYRLSQTDFDGTSETFEIISAWLTPIALNQTRFYPSLATHSLETENLWGREVHLNLSIISMDGLKISSLSPVLKQGKIILPLEESLIPGAYILKGRINDVEILQRVVIAK